MRNVTLPQVLLLAVLIAGIILAHRFAPGVGESVVSLASVAVAWLVPSPVKADAPKDAGPLAVLFLVATIAAASVTACDAFTGKYAGQDKLEDEISRHSDQIETCKNKARQARADEDASPDDALAVFDRCMAGATDGGVK